MTREEIYTQCVQEIAKTNCLLMELPTGFGKSKLSIDLCNYILNSKKHKEEFSILLLVAKRVHKQTWKEEMEKWGGINSEGSKVTIRMECYESLHKCEGYYDIILADEFHHIGSEQRLELLQYLQFGYFLGLSATIPKKLKFYFRYKYHSQIVSTNLVEAIEEEVLPEPEIILFPLQVENTRVCETIELNSKAPGPIVWGEYRDYWKLKKSKQHAMIRCTQKQKLMDLDKTIEWYKTKSMSSPALKQTWLYMCGKRLEFLSDCKVPWVKMILEKLKHHRTITFCKTIEQAEKLGKWCIHSKNGKATQYYDEFNAKKIHHITAVNILNENANLVECKYGIFCNLSSSEIIQVQRTGRMLRHKKPVLLIPYYQGTREQEIVEKSLEGFNKDFIKTIHSINEI